MKFFSAFLITAVCSTCGLQAGAQALARGQQIAMMSFDSSTVASAAEGIALDSAATILNEDGAGILRISLAQASSASGRFTLPVEALRGARIEVRLRAQGAN